MDVTVEQRQKRLIYGASDVTAPQGLAASKCLNYARGASIHNAEPIGVSVVPYTLRYQDAVGLFGVENHFVRVNLNVIGDILYVCYEEPDWQCAFATQASDIYDNTEYEPCEIDLGYFPPRETYIQAEIYGNQLPDLGKNRGYLSVELENLKTGNQYKDEWLDLRLYTQKREEHPYNKMYVKTNSFFYIGFHARNTKRLDYNVKCVIGREFRTEQSIENSQEIMRS